MIGLMRRVPGCAVLPAIALFAALGTACGRTPAAPPTTPGPGTPPAPGPSPSGPVTVTGTERIGWEQQVVAGSNIREYEFAAFVDARRTTLPDIQCSAEPGPSGHVCSAQLPYMTDGQHTIKIAASRLVEGRAPMSDRSDALIVIKGVAASTVVAELRIPSPHNPEGAQPFISQDSEGMAVDVVATGLAPVTDLAALPDGRIVIAEKSGLLRVVSDGRVAAAPMAAVQRVAQDGGGLMSVAPHPAFALNHLLYLLYAADTDRGVTYRLARGREVDGLLGELAVLGDLAPAEPGGSGALRFGADGMLYLALSDLSTPAAPASTASYRGKVLRLDDEGRTPDDSPSASPIFSSGHRLPSGLAVAPLDGRLFEAETAGSGRIHVLRQGARYGATAGPLGEAPAWDLGPGARPGGIIVYSGRAFPRWRGDLLVARQDGEGIMRVPLRGAGSADSALPNLTRAYGRIRSVVEAADGSLYFGTANRDAASSASEDDDRVVRVRPRDEAPRPRRLQGF